jgi:Uri superfamily endonuclease
LGGSTREPIPSASGIYVVVLRSSSTRRVRVGALGTLALELGFYAYVGSAHGPGGLAARVEHHRRRARSPRWHVDYLRRHTAFHEVWFAQEPREREHAWATALKRIPHASVPMPGFGCSDCECRSHLFRFARKPSPSAFRRRLDASMASGTPERGAAGRCFGILLAASASALLACDLGSPSVTSAESCTEAGVQCQLPDGPLGVCERAPCAPGATPPCFKCTPQH